MWSIWLLDPGRFVMVCNMVRSWVYTVENAYNIDGYFRSNTKGACKDCGLPGLNGKHIYASYIASGTSFEEWQVTSVITLLALNCANLLMGKKTQSSRSLENGEVLLTQERSPCKYFQVSWKYHVNSAAVYYYSERNKNMNWYLPCKSLWTWTHCSVSNAITLCSDTKIRALGRCTHIQILWLKLLKTAAQACSPARGQ